MPVEGHFEGSGAAQGIVGSEVDRDKHYIPGEGHFEGSLHKSGREREEREQRRAEP